MTPAISPVLGGGGADRRELAAAFAAARGRFGVVMLLVGLAALAWWWTAHRMAGMDAGPGTDLGALGWFLGVWVVMMAAMMFPSLAPTVALFATMTRRRGPDRALVFATGYLLVWGAAGLGAYALFELGRHFLGGALAWHAGGQALAAGVLAVAAAYELTPLKDVCLAKCRGPLGLVLGTWRDGRLGALDMGARNAGWCLGCCWALMAALFALGVMSLIWMAVIAVLIGLEKTLPWRRTITLSTAALLLALTIGVALAPHAVPGLVVPGASGGAMHGMHSMS